MFAKSLRAIAAIFVAMALNGASAAHADSGVSVSDNTCKVSGVEWSVVPNDQTRAIAGIYTGVIAKRGQCYVLVINRVSGDVVSGTFTWGPIGDWIGFTRSFTATVDRGAFTFATEPFAFDRYKVRYTVTIHGPWKLHVVYKYERPGYSPGHMGWKNHTVVPYTGLTASR